jgi:hypothetical protein
MVLRRGDRARPHRAPAGVGQSNIPRHSTKCSSGPRRNNCGADSVLQDLLRPERRHRHSRPVDGVADLEVDGDAADDVGLLAVEAAPLEQVHDVQDAPAVQIEISPGRPLGDHPNLFGPCPATCASHERGRPAAAPPGRLPSPVADFRLGQWPTGRPAAERVANSLNLHAIVRWHRRCPTSWRGSRSRDWRLPARAGRRVAPPGRGPVRTGSGSGRSPSGSRYRGTGSTPGASPGRTPRRARGPGRAG